MYEDSNTSYLGITESDFDDDPIQNMPLLKKIIWFHTKTNMS